MDIYLLSIHIFHEFIHEKLNKELQVIKKEKNIAYINMSKINFGLLFLKNDFVHCIYLLFS